MRKGGDQRGKARDRRIRKTKLLAIFGDGTTCPCVHCGRKLDFQTIEQDRITPGGSYRLLNVQPSCGPCNKIRSNDVAWVPPRQRKVQPA